MEGYIRRMRYMYLLNMAIPIGFLLLFPVWHALIGLVLLLTFVGFYWWSYQANSAARWVGLTGQSVILCVMMTLYNINYVWMVFYPAALIVIASQGNRRTIRRCVIGLCSVILISGLIGLHVQGGTPWEWPLLFSALIGMVATVLMVIGQQETLRAKTQLEQVNRQLERLTQMAERDRISQDLHDVMGHDLSLITLKAQLIVRLIEKDPVRAKAEARDVEMAARNALSRVREYIAEMRLPDIREEWDAACRLINTAGIQCQAIWDLGLDVPPSKETVGFSLALREAATNIVRHSQASRCVIRLSKGEGVLRLIVQDDGRGIPTGSPSGHGLPGMRARIEANAGEMAVWSNGLWLSPAPLCAVPLESWQKGTAVYFSIPYWFEQESAAL